MFKKCFSTLGCPDYSLDKVLDTAQIHGMDCVEIRALENEIDLPSYFIKNEISPEELKRRCHKSGVAIAAFGSSLKVTSDPSEWLNTLNALAPWIIAAEVPSVRLFDGASEGDFDDWIDLAKSRAQFWRELKAKHGWEFDLAIETHDTLIDASLILEFVAATESTFPILWDAHHTWRKGGEAWSVTWQACNRHIQHIHTKDSIGVPSARHPYTYTHMGQGEMNAEGLTQLLVDSNYSGILSLEWERMWHPYLDPIELALDNLNKSFTAIHT